MARTATLTLTLMLATALVVALSLSAAAVHVFSDVPDDHVHADGIHWAHALQIVRGYPDGTYRPGQSVTRGQLASVLHQQNAYIGPLYSMTPDCGSLEMSVFDANNRGSGPATVTYNVDGGDHFLVAEIPPEDPIVFEAHSSGVVTLFVDGLAQATAHTAETCTTTSPE